MDKPQNIERLIELYRGYGDIKGILEMAEAKGINTNRVTVSNCLNGKSCSTKILLLVADYFQDKANKFKQYGK